MSRRGSPLALVAVMLLPAAGLLLVFSYLPALVGLYRAFTHWETGEAPRWAGLANFAAMSHDEFLGISIGNQVLLLLAGLARTLLVPLAVAELLSQLRSHRWQYALRTAFTLPMVVPGMVTMLLWSFIYDGSVGLLNQLLELAGAGALTRSWLGEPRTALLAIVGVGFPWAGGLALLIYLAGINGIAPDVHDSGALDGATGWRRVLHIDVPLLQPQVRLLATLTIIGSLQDFGSILILTAGGPGLATHVPALHMYFQAFRFGHMGYAAAIGLALFGVIFALSVANMRWGRERGAAG
ncbi:MAG: sugar ABC transporter permease [Chthonomonadales bacterium]|nr:sugar ABC transporter permease [Chthonomonadales bacterium]